MLGCREGFFGLSWVAGKPLKVLMSVRRFRVEIGFQVSVMRFYHSIKEGKGFLGVFSSEVDGLMSGIAVGNDVVQLLSSMSPEQEYIVDVASQIRGDLGAID